jgi:hypothetical protein
VGRPPQQIQMRKARREILRQVDQPIDDGGYFFEVLLKILVDVLDTYTPGLTSIAPDDEAESVDGFTMLDMLAPSLQ